MAWQKKHLTEEEKSGDAKKANARAVWYLSQRDHGAEELYQKLCRFFTEQAAAAAVADMVELCYLDDARYARNKANSLLRAHKSRREISQKLAQKGLDRNVIAQTLAELYQPDAQLDAQMNEQIPTWGAGRADAVQFVTDSTWQNEEQAQMQDPELNAVMVLIQRRYARKLEIGRKDLVVAALMRRGFPYGVIRTAFAQLDGNEA